MRRLTTSRSSALRKAVLGAIGIRAILARCAARSYPCAAAGGAGCGSALVPTQAAVVSDRAASSATRILLSSDSALPRVGTPTIRQQSSAVAVAQKAGAPTAAAPQPLHDRRYT